MSDRLPQASIECVDSIASLRQAVGDSESALVVGHRSKPALSAVALSAAARNTTLIGTDKLSGFLQYEPSEFTFTALAGTTLAEISETLAAKNQYLPFDPPLSENGATIGGTLAAGMSGPGRHRYGGVRDFVLGAQFLAGDGQLIQSGGKVVKNAAGFDIPKLLVGSCGRLAAITSLTFKVFPRPVEFWSYSIDVESHQHAVQVIAQLARGRWELDAIDYHAATRTIWVRIGGPHDVTNMIASDLAGVLRGRNVVNMDRDEADAFWCRLSEFQFASDQFADQRHCENSPSTAREREISSGSIPRSPAGLGKDEASFASDDVRLACIAKVPLTLDAMRALASWCDESSQPCVLHASVAGSVGWLAFSADMIERVDSFLKSLQLSGLLIRGCRSDESCCVIGSRKLQPIEWAVKKAMDPPGRFPGLFATRDDS